MKSRFGILSLALVISLFCFGCGYPHHHSEGSFVWEEVIPPTSVNMNAVWGSDANDVWFVGDGGTIMHWDGSILKLVSSGTTLNLYGVNGTGKDDIWAVGGDVVNSFDIRDSYGFVVLHWNGKKWTSTEVEGSSEEWIALFGVWCNGKNDVWVTGGSQETGVTENGHGLIGKWEGNYITGIGYEGLGIENVWGIDDKLWFMGADGTLLSWNGSTLESVTSNTTNDIHAMWGADKNDVWAVCDIGTTDKNNIIHWDGNIWNASNVAAVGDISGIWGSDANNIWIVGAGIKSVGIIMHWDGNNYSETMHTSSFIKSIWGSDPNNIWAVGEYGLVLHYYFLRYAYA